LEGLRVALKNIEEVIDLIRKAPDVEAARDRLMKRYKLSEIQSNAILDMPLRRLAALERKKIEVEYKEVQALIKELEGLLKSPKKMRDTVAAELNEVKENYGDRRRTQIVTTNGDVSKADFLTARDLAPDETTWVVVDEDGLISRTHVDQTPRLWGRTAPRWVLKSNTRDTLYLVAENGDTAAMAVHALPEAEMADQGAPLNKTTPLSDKHTLAAMFSLPPKSDRGAGWFVMTATRDGIVKKSDLEELPGPSSQPFTLAKTKEGDRIGWVDLTDGKSDIVMVTANGMAIRFKEDDIRAMGLVAAGVNGIKLKAGDEVVGAKALNKEYEVFLLASDGKAKRVRPSQFPVQGRYGQGVSVWKLDEGVRLMGMANDKPNQEVTIHLSKAAAKKTRLDAAPVRTRPSNGKEVVEVKDSDRIVMMTAPWEAPGGMDKSPSGAKKAAKAEEPAQMEMSLENGKPPAKKKTASKKKTTAKKAPTKKKTAAKTKAKTKTKAKKKSSPKKK
jgi:DNA gyrase subunit A